MKIAITGATGFLGRALVQRVARDHEVIATARGITGSGHFGTSVRFVPADIADETTLRSAFAGCDVVIHAAALSTPWGRASEFERINVEGTRAVVEAAQASGVRRLVHVSSTSLYFAFQDRFAIAEDSPLPPPVNAYADTKRRAEFEAERFEGEVFIARPRGIFGPGDRTLLPRLLMVAHKGSLPLIRGGRAICDITFIDTVTDALLLMSDAPADTAGIYNIAQGEPIAIRALVERLLTGIGRPVRWQYLPVPLAFTGARLLEFFARLDPWRREPLVTAYGLGLFSYAQTLDLGRAHTLLGWRPAVSLDEGLDRTIHAFRAAS